MNDCYFSAINGVVNTIAWGQTVGQNEVPVYFDLCAEE